MIREHVQVNTWLQEEERMNTRKIVLMVSTLLTCVALYAREIRTPWTLSHGFNQYPLLTHTTYRDQPWYIQPWAGYHHKRAHKAYGDDHGNNTVSIADVLFNTSSFTMLDLIPPASRASLTCKEINLFSQFCTIIHELDY